jgi:spermidine synthase
VLIVGGGDGAVAKELLKYNFIKKIDLVDIDQEVVNLSKQYLIKINDNSLKNNKLNLFYEDAFNYIKNTKNKYDIIIADRPDPIGAGKSLFKKEFYKHINNIISPEGISVFQSGVPFFQKKELKTVLRDVSRYFKYSGYYLTVVPSYVGGFMALVWSSNKVDISKISISKKKYAVSTNYYNQNILVSSFIAPNFIKKL